MKKIFFIIGILWCASLSVPVFAESDLPPLYISAFNAGFKDDTAAQNYDFIELARSGAEDVSLTGVELRYFNSSGNFAGAISFADD
jgi:hypothetical protein